MAVTLTTPVIPAVPSYDKIHLISLVIAAEKTDYAKTTVQARVCLYYQDPTTLIKTFAPEYKDIFIDDAQAWATILATHATPDMRGVTAATEIKNMISLLADTQTNWGTSTVV